MISSLGKEAETIGEDDLRDILIDLEKIELIYDSRNKTIVEMV